MKVLRISNRTALRRTVLIAICGVGTLSCFAQSSVALKLETTQGGASVANVTIIFREVKEGSSPGSPREIIAKGTVGDVPKDSGKFVAQHLQKGLYEFYACDKGLKFEPAAGERRVGNNDDTKLLLEFNDVSVRKPVLGAKPGSQACLIHIQTRCKAPREIKVDQKGTYIEHRGLDDHYVVDPQPCEPVSMPAPIECTTPTATTPTASCPFAQ